MAKQSKKIDFYRPPVGTQEAAAVTRALKRGWLTSGPEAVRFEEEISAFLGCKYALATSSGTAALHLGLLARRLGQHGRISPHSGWLFLY